MYWASYILLILNTCEHEIDLPILIINWKTCFHIIISTWILMSIWSFCGQKDRISRCTTLGYSLRFWLQHVGSIIWISPGIQLHALHPFFQWSKISVHIWKLRFLKCITYICYKRISWVQYTDTGWILHVMKSLKSNTVWSAKWHGWRIIIGFRQPFLAFSLSKWDA